MSAVSNVVPGIEVLPYMSHQTTPAGYNFKPCMTARFTNIGSAVFPRPILLKIEVPAEEFCSFLYTDRVRGSTVVKRFQISCNIDRPGVYDAVSSAYKDELYVPTVENCTIKTGVFELVPPRPNEVISNDPPAICPAF